MTSSIFVSLLGTVPISFDGLSVQRLCYGFRWLFSRYFSTLDVLLADMSSTGVLTLHSQHSIFWSKVLSSCYHVVWAVSTLEKCYLSLKVDGHHDRDGVPSHQRLCFWALRAMVLMPFHILTAIPQCPPHTAWEVRKPGSVSPVRPFLQSCPGILCHLYFHTNFRFCLPVSPKVPVGTIWRFFFKICINMGSGILLISNHPAHRFSTFSH